MENEVRMKIIAHIYNDYSEKFGIPRQSGMVDSVVSKIIFEPQYRNIDAFRGLDGFSHLWLLWQFSKAASERFSPTVRPPRLGGNMRMGVFATRSPYRPNSIGLSSVKLIELKNDENNGPVLFVSGADILNGTPIFDIKPYLAYTDSHPSATGGFVTENTQELLQVECSKELLLKLPKEKREALIEVLAQDPRPAYHSDPTKIYGMKFAEAEIKFTVDGNILRVTDIIV
ncbi:MAG: tRNA (N6-threonylcarbamoyladenosine(37)-N6)-methyltransferase TrmO [Oscillospiraceae bacterium]|nr:tRNA (N6-threonylcarbamoyladenosine(37)-N6)-methyltransferase TrmO [Oscillospiraceae bacterium]